MRAVVPTCSGGDETISMSVMTSTRQSLRYRLVCLYSGSGLGLECVMGIDRAWLSSAALCWTGAVFPPSLLGSSKLRSMSGCQVTITSFSK